MNILEVLEQNIDNAYRKFSSGLLPGVENILGVRLPVLRKIAKDIYKKEDWQSFLKIKSTYMEETLLKAFIIGLIKDNPEKILKYVSDFIPQIDNWSVCDSFCSSLKFTKGNRKVVWKFIKQYAKSGNEFSSRFAFVMMLNYFTDKEYLQRIFDILNDFNNRNFYSQMAVAWLISICYIKYPQETEMFLNSTDIDKFTLKKAIQKIGESKRINRNSEEYHDLKKLII